MNRFGSVSRQSFNPLLCFLIASSACLSAVAQCQSQEPPANGRDPQRWAVILVGLPGDAEHAATFRKLADQIQKWLIESQRIPAEQVLRLPEEATEGEASSALPTAESMSAMLAEVNSKLLADDSLWVFTLGHGNYDGRRAWFHVAGKDPSHEEFGRWMADVRCREQVIWLTHSSSGWFIKPLSRPGRLVIAATATDDESNETEFARAFTTMIKSPVASLDSNQDNAVSVAELYTAVVHEVLRRFQYDKRLPTEHAQLDDNGDGLGTEDLALAESDDPRSGAPKVPTPNLDGNLARTILIPYPVVERATDEQKPAE